MHFSNLQPQVSNDKYYTITRLEFYATYKVQVNALYTSHQSGQWGDWSEAVTCKTGEGGEYWIVNV